jgi:hypothetical protein
MRWVVFTYAIVFGVIAYTATPTRPVTGTPRASMQMDSAALTNRAPYIPVQCYAKTKRDDRVSNSCATCHRASEAPNYTSDADVQLRMTLPAYATQNRWTNALHPPKPVALDDASTLAYVRTNNYRGFEGCAFAPDAEGWDRDARGDLTGWRSFAYEPLPGMFWPTNGSFGDAYIRLPAPYRRDAATYALNLAIAESMITRKNVAIPATDERTYDVDLDGDGTRGVARVVKFSAQQRYLTDGKNLAIAGLYPVGTELIHSLRYLDVVDGISRPAARMKEVRYMRKVRNVSYAEHELRATREGREKELEPNELRTIFGDGTRVNTGTGWAMEGMIEAADGTLRRQTFEESAACIGCHSGIGATTDSTFTFARKTGWGPQALGKIDTKPYFEAVGAGDDFAMNDELMRDPNALIPSPARALALDRAYLAIVREQSYVKGRDVFLGTPAIEEHVTQDAPTGIVEPLAR